MNRLRPVLEKVAAVEWHVRFFHQDLRDLEVPFKARDVQRLLAVLVAGPQLRALAYEPAHERQVSLGAGCVNGLKTRVRDGVQQRRLLGDDPLGDRKLPACRGVVHWLRSVRVASLQARAPVKEPLHQFKVAAAACRVNRLRSFVVHLCVNAAASEAQSLCVGQVAVARRLIELFIELLRRHRVARLALRVRHRAAGWPVRAARLERRVITRHGSLVALARHAYVSPLA